MLTVHFQDEHMQNMLINPLRAIIFTLTCHWGTCWGIYFRLPSLHSYSYSYSYCSFSLESLDSSKEQLWETPPCTLSFSQSLSHTHSLYFLSVSFENYLRLWILNNHKHGGTKTHHLSFGPGAFFLMPCCHMDGLHRTNEWSGWNEFERPQALHSPLMHTQSWAFKFYTPYLQWLLGSLGSYLCMWHASHWVTFISF